MTAFDSTRDTSIAPRPTWNRQVAAILALAAGAAVSTPGFSPATTHSPLDGALRARIVDSLATTLEAHYILPDTAGLLAREIRERAAHGDYAGITDLGRFTRQLSADLREVSHDRHLLVTTLSPEDVHLGGADTLTADDIAQRARDNFGFQRVERLLGNVGYLELRMFENATIASEAAAAAIGFMARCDAVIIDVRMNGGGEESMVQLMCSYFMKEPTKLRTFSYRTAEPEQSWSLPCVPGPDLHDASVYILTDRYTASAAEAFASAMQSLRGAVVVGEPTRGAAYTVDFFDFPELGVRARISTGQPIEAETGGNWERVGVRPDIEVESHEALARAHQDVLEKLAAAEPDDWTRFEIDWALAGYEAKRHPVTLTKRELERFTGGYEGLRVFLNDGELRFQRGQRSPERMTPLTEVLFALPDMPGSRVEFTLDERDSVTGLRFLFEDHYVLTRLRTGDD
jgi:hypothetical protein